MKGKAIRALIDMNERRKLSVLILNGILSKVTDPALRTLLRQYHEERDAALLALARAFRENGQRKTTRRRP